MTEPHHHSHLHPHRTHLRLGLALTLTIALVAAEVVAGYLADSLALLTDAVHNLTDVAALAITWYAVHLAAQPSHAGKTFGYHRVGILAALVNSSVLIVIAAGIFLEAYERLRSPPEVMADLLIAVGAAAFVINLITAWLVGHGSYDDLNLRSAFLHLLGDVFSTLGAVVAGIGIRLTGLNWLDPAASAIIGLLIIWNAWLIVKETVDILLESAPRDIEVSTLVRDILQIDRVRGVHDLHIWSIAKHLRILSAHIVLDDMTISEGASVQRVIKEMLANRYGIDHSTLQIECQGCSPDPLYCDISRDPTHSQRDKGG